MSLSVIILSKTVDDFVYKTTLKCISSLENSESFKPGELEIILIESNPEYKKLFTYPAQVKVLIPQQEFGFHKFLNIGIQAATKDYIALCNNDLVFHDKWFSEILTISNQHSDILSFSPIDPNKELNTYKEEYLLGYKVTKHIKGWCLVCKKELFKKIGFLDEAFTFYYSDNDYALNLLYHNIRHALVTKSKVEHLHQVTTKAVINKKDVFFEKVHQGIKIPRYLNHPNLKWILTDTRVLFDHLIYYKKWGKPGSLYRLISYSESLNAMHLNFVVKAIFLLKRFLRI